MRGKGKGGEREARGEKMTELVCVACDVGILGVADSDRCWAIVQEAASITSRLAL